MDPGSGGGLHVRGAYGKQPAGRRTEVFGNG
jgi:hypothetical protein